MSLRTLALGAAMMHTGCAFVAAAGVNHGGGRGCMASPAPAGIDLVLGAAGTAGLLATGVAEETPAYLILPGVFLMSGLIGSASAYSCRNRDGVGEKATPIVYPAVDPTPADDPSTARDATPEELGISGPGATPVHVEPVFAPPPGPAPGQPDTRVKCQIRPLTPCPSEHSCVLFEGDHGYCVLDR